jgi:hypothetical protein
MASCGHCWWRVLRVLDVAEVGQQSLLGIMRCTSGQSAGQDTAPPVKARRFFAHSE